MDMAHWAPDSTSIRDCTSKSSWLQKLSQQPFQLHSYTFLVRCSVLHGSLPLLPYLSWDFASCQWLSEMALFLPKTINTAEKAWRNAGKIQIRDAILLQNDLSSSHVTIPSLSPHSPLGIFQLGCPFQRRLGKHPRTIGWEETTSTTTSGSLSSPAITSEQDLVR